MFVLIISTLIMIQQLKFPCGRRIIIALFMFMQPLETNSMWPLTIKLTLSSKAFKMGTVEIMNILHTNMPLYQKKTM